MVDKCKICGSEIFTIKMDEVYDLDFNDFVDTEVKTCTGCLTKYYMLDDFLITETPLRDCKSEEVKYAPTDYHLKINPVKYGATN